MKKLSLKGDQVHSKESKQKAVVEFDKQTEIYISSIYDDLRLKDSSFSKLVPNTYQISSANSGIGSFIFIKVRILSNT